MFKWYGTIDTQLRCMKAKKPNCTHTCDTSLTGCVPASQILLQGKNPGVVWEYTLPRTERKPDYSWGVVRSDCSAPCAGGETVFDVFVSAMEPEELCVHVSCT